MPEDKYKKTDDYYKARRAIETFFEGWGQDCESSIEDVNGDIWSSHVVMTGFYVRLKDGKVSKKDPEDNPPP